MSQLFLRTELRLSFWNLFSWIWGYSSRELKGYQEAVSLKDLSHRSDEVSALHTGKAGTSATGGRS